MKWKLPIACFLLALLPCSGGAQTAAPPLLEQMAEPQISLELNSLEIAGLRCGVPFLIRNDGVELTSLRVELALFDRAGVLQRRVLADMGPLMSGKTVLKTFLMDMSCHTIGSILLNDIPSCPPLDPSTCLDLVSLRSRIADTRFYK
jgi:hypothetical protein